MNQSEAERQLTNDLQHLGKGFVMTRPSRSAKPMRWTATGNSRRRRRTPCGFGRNRARPFDVFTARDNAQTHSLACWSCFDLSVDLRDRGHTPAVDAPDDVAFP